MAMAACLFGAVSCGEKENTGDNNGNNGGNSGNDQVAYNLIYQDQTINDGDTIVFNVVSEDIIVGISIQNTMDTPLDMQVKYDEILMSGLMYAGLCVGEACQASNITQPFTIPANATESEFHLTMAATAAINANLSGLCKLTFGEANTFAGSKNVYVRFAVAQ